MIGSPLVIAERARARMAAVVARLRQGEDISAGSLVRPRETPSAVDLVITACEITPAHGTGTLLLRIFPDSRDIISLRTSNFYAGEQRFGVAQYCLPLAQSSQPEILSWVKWCLAGTRVRRILALPYLPADPLVALAAHQLTGAPLCTYVMDDKNVCADGIDDALMARMLQASALRLVISPEMQRVYARKYHLAFHVMPPLVPEALLRRAPARPSLDATSRSGILLGNIWGQIWLDRLRATFRDTGYPVDWFCNQKDPAGLTFDREEMRRDGITFHEPAAEAALPELLRRYTYAVVPTDTLDGQSPPSVRAIAELSLPSRIPTMVAMSHIPVLVIGSPETCAARFVTRFRLGEVVPYETDRVVAALRSLTSPEKQAELRANAATLAGELSAEGSAEWIWRSLELGRPADDRYERLMPEPALADD